MKKKIDFTSLGSALIFSCALICILLIIESFNAYGKLLLEYQTLLTASIIMFFLTHLMIFMTFFLHSKLNSKKRGE